MLLSRRAVLAAAAMNIAPGVAPGGNYMRFGPDFAFGVSSSAYQIEGAVHEDGRGTGIWDVFCHTPDHIWHNGNADVAAGHYQLMPEDVALMANAGLRNYRFSVSWPRLFPAGSGAKNPAGFDFYDRLLDELHKHEITPWMCLYHWDLPQNFENKGGWTDRDTAYRFADFAESVSRHYSGRVKNWMMLNEAAVHSIFGYGMGTHAPGRTGRANWFAALHHLNLGQGMAIQALRDNHVPGRIGTVACVEPVRPSTLKAEDQQAAALVDAVWNGSVLDPLLKGQYPALVQDEFAPLCRQDDLKKMHHRIDLLGVNYYNRLHIVADPANPVGVGFGPSLEPRKYTVMGWPIEPDGIYEVTMEITQNYNNQEIFISENGYATTYGQKGGEIDDPERITYLSDHLKFLKRAVDDGANITGYFVWAFLDSFEWNDGMRWHFGLVNVDFETLKRTPKKSYAWYAALVQANSVKTV